MRAPPAWRGVAFVLLLAIAASGCLGPEKEGHRLTGAFTSEASAAEVEAFQRELFDAYEAEVLIMESFPMQFQVLGLPEARCEEARALVAAKPYVARVSACLPP